MGAERGHHLRDLRRLIGGFILGLLVGAALGALATWVLMRRRATPAPAQVRPSAVPFPEPVAGEPEPTGDDVRQALDATRGLLDELERRYQQPPPEVTPKAPRRRPDRKDRT